MKNSPWVALFIAAVVNLTSDCAAQTKVGGVDTQRQPASNSAGNKVTNPGTAINKRFRNLHEYLAWLEKTQAPVDGAWYRKIGPDQYELQTGNLRIMGEDGTEKRIFTYAELAVQFGFDQ